MFNKEKLISKLTKYKEVIQPNEHFFVKNVRRDIINKKTIEVTRGLVEGWIISLNNNDDYPYGFAGFIGENTQQIYKKLLTFKRIPIDEDIFKEKLTVLYYMIPHGYSYTTEFGEINKSVVNHWYEYPHKINDMVGLMSCCNEIYRELKLLKENNDKHR